jgi:hypothetical protein
MLDTVPGWDLRHQERGCPIVSHPSWGYGALLRVRAGEERPPRSSASGAERENNRCSGGYDPDGQGYCLISQIKTLWTTEKMCCRASLSIPGKQDLQEPANLPTVEYIWDKDMREELIPTQPTTLCRGARPAGSKVGRDDVSRYLPIW